MRKLIAVLIGLAGLAGGLYLSIVVLFIGGIQEIIHAASFHPLAGSMLGWGIAKIFFCEVGGLVMWPAFGIAALIWPDMPKPRRVGTTARQTERNYSRAMGRP